MEALIDNILIANTRENGKVEQLKIPVLEHNFLGAITLLSALSRYLPRQL